ncbi:MAG: nitrogen fixation protein NifQ [Gammaproteobacteria bacterium]|nr:nitrogen fixation protein NifQ [Gammaproteobacteria bacterium]
MSCAVEVDRSPEDLCDALLAARRGERVEIFLAQMLTSWALGMGSLSGWMGLSRLRFQEMMAYHFPRFDPQLLGEPNRWPDPERAQESTELRQLLQQGRTPGEREDPLLCDIVIAGCMGEDHLWQDLGLWSRKELSQLMQEQFAPLAKRNDKDMKWKKFLYKQLCETEGIYTCRAPSCEQCHDYELCFGPEEGGV